MPIASSLPEFGDFDDGNVYETVKEGIFREETLNFVIEFDSTKACAAHDLDVGSIKQLLNLEASGSGSIRFARPRDCLHTLFFKAWTLIFNEISDQNIQVQDGCV